MENLTQEQETRVLKELDRYDIVERYEDHLNSLHSSVYINGAEYEPSEILKNCNRKEYDLWLAKFCVDYFRIGSKQYSYYLIEDIEALFGM